MIKTNIYLPKKVFSDLEKYAKHGNTSVQSILQKVVKDILAKNKDQIQTN